MNSDAKIAVQTAREWRSQGAPLSNVECFDAIGCNHSGIGRSGEEVDLLLYNLCGLTGDEIGAVEILLSE